MSRLILALLAAGCVAAAQTPPARAQSAPPPNWTETKCERYRDAWSEALKRFGAQGLSAEFIRKHDEFVATGCVAQADVCPRSKEELALANVMVLRAMNAGASSTFLPFACRK